MNDPDLWSQPDYQGRDRALIALEATRPAVIYALRQAAEKLWEQTRQPLSVNDLREALAELQYEGDPRILGAVFMKSAGWVPVGFTMVKGSKAHARMIRTFQRLT